MSRTILLVSTATLWLGTARMPRALAKAGFDVALLAPNDSLALKSRFVSRVGLLSDDAGPMEFLFALMRMIDKVSPQLLVPCDEMAVRLLFTLMLNPPRGLEAAIESRLAPLIRTSLGDPEFYAASIDKTLLPSAAEASGVRMPRSATFTRVEDAEMFAEANGYPVVLKRRFGFAGKGVEIVATRGELVAAARRLLRPDQLDLGDPRPRSLLVQAFISGPHHSQALVALGGVPCAGFAWERHAATHPVQGQTTVLRFVDSPETRAFSETLCRAFGICGFFNVQFAIDAATGAAHLLEINRRSLSVIRITS